MGVGCGLQCGEEGVWASVYVAMVSSTEITAPSARLPRTQVSSIRRLLGVAKQGKADMDCVISIFF